MKTNELSCKDLMIWDWVYNTYNQQNEQVQEIRSGLVMLNYNDLYEYNEIEPITLVPEILEKNGFENIGDDTYQLEEKPCWFWVDFFNHQYGCEYDTSTYEYEDDEHRFKLYGIPSVHELQHALRLCGIEKEIIL